jgi:hypothetical protein
MQHRKLAELAGVSEQDVSNLAHGRENYLSSEKEARIRIFLSMSKIDLALYWLSKGNTLTPIQSLEWFHLHSLSQTITKLRNKGYDIRNISKHGPHDYAIYKLFTEEK